MQAGTFAYCAVARITRSMRIYSIVRKRPPLQPAQRNTQPRHKHASQLPTGIAGQSPAQPSTSQTQHNDAPTHHAHTTQTPPPAPRPEKGRRLLPLGLRPPLCGLSPRCGLLMRGLRTGRASLQRCNTAVQRAQYTRPPGALGASLRSASRPQQSWGRPLCVQRPPPTEVAGLAGYSPRPYIWCVPHNSRETI